MTLSLNWLIIVSMVLIWPQLTIIFLKIDLHLTVYHYCRDDGIISAVDYIFTNRWQFLYKQGPSIATRVEGLYRKINFICLHPMKVSLPANELYIWSLYSTYSGDTRRRHNSFTQFCVHCDRNQKFDNCVILCRDRMIYLPIHSTVSLFVCSSVHTSMLPSIQAYVFNLLT